MDKKQAHVRSGTNGIAANETRCHCKWNGREGEHDFKNGRRCDRRGGQAKVFSKEQTETSPLWFAKTLADFEINDRVARRHCSIPHCGHARNGGGLAQGRIPFVLEADLQGQEAGRETTDVEGD